MVFPYCDPGSGQAPTPDLKALGAKLMDRFVYTAAARYGEVAWNSKSNKIGPSIFILEDLHQDPKEKCKVRARAVRQLFMGTDLTMGDDEAYELWVFGPLSSCCGQSLIRL